MSSIQRLEISGIRCFAPDEAQGIEFQKPLTVICGQNGCGKTTVIECLKYATTGALPPNSKRGQSFIHDPKISKVSEVKASIKLLFQTRADQRAFVGKNLRLVQKRNNRQEFQALDMVMKTKDPVSGKTRSQSNKCSELDRLVPAFLGVSRAILENVIFCHQEDSNWPLQEGSVLKKKFDDIFESSRYTKALEAIRTEKKRISGELKDANHTVELNLTHLKQYENLTSSLKKLNTQLETFQSQIHDHESTITNMTTERDELERKTQAVQTMQDNLRNLESELKVKSEILDKGNTLISEDIQKLLTEIDLESLTREDKAKKVLSAYQVIYDGGQKEIDSNKAEMRRLEERKDKFQRLIRIERAKLDKAKEKLTTLVEKQHNIQYRAKTFGRIISNLINRFGLDVVCASQSTEIGESEFLSRVQREGALLKVKELQRSLQNEMVIEKEKADAERERFSNEMNELKSQITVLANEENSRKNDKKLLDNNLRSIDRELDQLRTGAQGSSIAPEQIEKQLETANTELELHKQNERTIQELGIEVKQLEEEAAIVQVELSKLTEIKDDLEKHQNDVAIVTSRKTDFFKLIDTIVQEKLPYCKTLGVEVKDIETQLQKCLEARENNFPIMFKHFAETMKATLQIVSEQVTNSHGALSSRLTKIKTDKNSRNMNMNRLKGRKDAAFKALENARVQADTLESTLPRLSILNTLASVSQNISSSATEEASSVIKAKVNGLHEKYLETKLRSRILKKYGEVMLKQGKCPVCSQTIAEDFSRFFETDFSVALNINPEVQLHGALFDEPSTKNIIVENDKRRKQNDGSIETLHGCNFNCPKNKEITGVLAAAGNSIFESLRKENELEILKAGYNAALEEQKEFDANKFAFLKLADLKENILPTLEAEWRVVSEEEKTLLQDVKRLISSEKETTISLSAMKGSKDAFFDLERLAVNLCDQAFAIGDQQALLEKNLTKYSGSEMSKKYSFDSIKEEVTSKQLRKEFLQNQIQSNRNRTDDFRSKLYQLSQSVMQLQDMQIRSKDNDAKRIELTQNRNRISEEAKVVGRKIVHFMQEQGPLKRKMDQLVTERDSSRKDADARVSEFETRARDFWTDSQPLRTSHEEMNGLENECVGQQITTATREVERLDKQVSVFDGNITDCDKEVVRRQNDLHSQKKVMKDLEDCIDLKKQEMEVLAIEQERDKLLERIQKAVGNLDEVASRLEKVSQLLNETKLKRERLSGQQTQIVHSKDAVLKELRQKELRNIQERYSDSVIDANTLSLAEGDLSQYYKALDTALVQFHYIKINEINEQIRELWNLTYQGGDIDRIEIRSDNESGAATARNSRSYNYRVVMYKGTTELDMRGRCSAGQKVLASLVIRMALGSSFSADCGILTLDEPTTNLDTENKKSLAHALAVIIKERSDEASFQLIIITHDEEFVDLLRENIAVVGKAAYYTIRRELNTSGKFVSLISKRL